MTPDQKRREAAEKYQSDWDHHRFRYSKDYTPESAFLAGCEYEAKEAEARGFARAVELYNKYAQIVEKQK